MPDRKFHILLRMTCVLPYIFVVLGVLSVNMLHAQQFTATLTQDSILIGDQIALQFEVKIPADATLTGMPALNDSVGKIEVLNKSNIDSAKDKVTKIYRQSYTLTSFDSGSYSLPTFQVQYLQAGNTQTLMSDKLELYVNTIPVDTAADFKPIFDIEPEDAPDLMTQVIDHFKNYKFWYLIGLAILLIAAAILFFIIRYLNNRKKIIPTITEAPYAKAKRRLADIQQSSLWKDGQYKVIAIEISDILRDYIEESYALPANEMTTRDLLLKVKKSKALRPIHQEMRSVLQLSDLIKFAKLTPTDTDFQELLKLSNKIIDTTNQPTSTKQ